MSIIIDSVDTTGLLLPGTHIYDISDCLCNGVIPEEYAYLVGTASYVLNKDVAVRAYIKTSKYNQAFMTTVIIPGESTITVIGDTIVVNKLVCEDHICIENQHDEVESVLSKIWSASRMLMWLPLMQRMVYTTYDYIPDNGPITYTINMFVNAGGSQITVTTIDNVYNSI